MLERVAQILIALGTELHSHRERTIAPGAPASKDFGVKADLFAHDVLSRELAALGAGIPIVSEEDAASQRAPRPDRYWLIDPIDGTASYCGGFPGYVTQLALIDKSSPVLGAVYAPATDEIFLAERGNGARRNGATLHVKPAPRRRRLIDNYPEPRGTAANLYGPLGCDGYVESGSLGLKICRIADGTAELFFKDVVLRDWDIAPGAVILEEAGGIITAISGAPFPFHGNFEKPGVIAAATPTLANSVAGALQGVTA